MEKPVLVILAAGMGSRYGGLKQIDTVGTNGECIIDFSIYDAHEAGFEKVILIIRKEHEEAFRKSLTNEVSRKMEVEFAYQNMEDIPAGIDIPEGREKPWGTTHALLACRSLVKGPFMICNADDYYGKEAFKTMYQFLTSEVQDGAYGMVGYQCDNTLTDNGTVTRGVCEMKDGYLQAIKEVQKIACQEGKDVFEEDGVWKELPKDTLVSMNFWGFTPAIFDQCQSIFETFIRSGIKENPMKCEHVIPTAVQELLKQKQASVKVMTSHDVWCGVTYKEDKPLVQQRLAEAKEKGEYPFDLWK